MRIHPLLGAAFACLVPVACVTGGAQWIGDMSGAKEPVRDSPLGWSSARPEQASVEAETVDWVIKPSDSPSVLSVHDVPSEILDLDLDDKRPPVLLRDHGAPRPVRPPAGAAGVFRNTYYDFPSEGFGPKEATLFDASCAPIARVTTDFHDRVCMQGSGRLADGATVSFATRGCGCAALCPRTGQQICFERLDPARFPSGRGATGRPITPLRTVAVDSSVIVLGTPLYIPAYVGVKRPDGTAHDGCFLAEDRGIRVVGQHIDLFTGDPAVTARWNALVPSNQGVHVYPNHPACRSGATQR